jgi:hypothetical protein
MSMRTDDVLDTAQDLLGSGYREIGENTGVFRSADDTLQFRMTDGDILGLHNGGAHVNFETVAPHPTIPDKEVLGTNIHVFLED